MSHPDAESTRRTVRGVIESIQESWPLQLIVQAGQERVAVALTDNTVVVHAGLPSDTSALRVTQRVAVEGVVSSVAPPAMVAERIEILT